jgi:hypothetical protein
MVKRGILVLLMLAPLNLMADQIFYVDPINGTGSACTQVAPCDTLGEAFSQVSDTASIVVGFGLITSTGYASFFADFLNSNFTSRQDTSKYVTLISSRMYYDGTPGDIRWSTSTTIFQSNAPAVFNFDHVIYKGFLHIGNGSAFEISDSSFVKVMQCGFKNPHNWSTEYSHGVTVASRNNNNGTEVGSHHILLEDVWVVGISRYPILVGGTDPLVSSTTIRRCVVRNDGTASPQPVAGINVYGAASGGIDGTQNTLIENSIAIDFNNDGATFYPGGESVYSGFYLAHGPDRHKNYESISIALGTNWSGFGLGEDSVTKVAYYDCVSWDVGSQGMIGNATAGSSITIKGCTIGRSRGTNEAIAFYNSFSQTSLTSSLLHRNRTAMQNASNNYFGFFTSTENVGNSTNEVTATPTPDHNIYIASRTESTYIGAGLDGRNIGASIRWKRGVSGTYNSDPGAEELQIGDSLWPWPYESTIKSLFAQADAGDAATNNSSNNEQRGFANMSSTGTLSSYIWEYDGALAPDFVFSAQEGGSEPCNGVSLNPSIGSLTSSGLTASWTDSTANHTVALASDSGFSSILSSASLSGATSSYVNLNSSTEYFFKVKVSSNPDCAYTSTSGTTLANPPTGIPQKLQFQGSINIRGVKF